MLNWRKYVTIITDPIQESNPKILLDWFYLKPNLRTHWNSCKTFQMEIAFFGINLCVILNWGFIERNRTKREDDFHKANLEFIELLSSKENDEAQ